mmetsp:Transcript_37085/g.83765  ORF Transcript_37085/g.83765 Transcript_37085/m.83765 type:complete len:280 (-) Transcript_37085:142-981(-)
MGEAAGSGRPGIHRRGKDGKHEQAGGKKGAAGVQGAMVLYLSDLRDHVGLVMDALLEGGGDGDEQTDGHVRQVYDGVLDVGLQEPDNLPQPGQEHRQLPEDGDDLLAEEGVRRRHVSHHRLQHLAEVCLGDLVDPVVEDAELPLDDLHDGVLAVHPGDADFGAGRQGRLQGVNLLRDEGDQRVHLFALLSEEVQQELGGILVQLEAFASGFELPDSAGGSLAQVGGAPYHLQQRRVDPLRERLVTHGPEQLVRHHLQLCHAHVVDHLRQARNAGNLSGE